MQAKVSSRVRDELARRFVSGMLLRLDGVAGKGPGKVNRMAYTHYGDPSVSDTIWG